MAPNFYWVVILDLLNLLATRAMASLAQAVVNFLLLVLTWTEL